MGLVLMFFLFGYRQNILEEENVTVERGVGDGSGLLGLQFSRNVSEQWVQWKQDGLQVICLPLLGC
jgi:hypothetical protein